MEIAVREALAGTGDSGDEISFPCVLKPTFLAASRGVIRADDADGFRRAAQKYHLFLKKIPHNLLMYDNMQTLY